MQIIQVNAPDNGHKQVIMQLWNNEYPAFMELASLQHLDLYLETLEHPRHYFVKDKENKLSGWAVLFRRQQETWFAVIVDSACQKQGIGTRLLNALKQEQGQLNGWVIDRSGNVRADGMPYAPPLAFYMKQGFRLVKEQRLEKEQLSAVKITWEAQQ